MKNIKIAILPALIIVVLVTLTIGCGGSSDADSGGKSRLKQSVANRERFVLKDINGKDRRWSEFVGKPLIINFWASWCGPCRQETPLLIQLYEANRDKGLQIVGISVDHQRERVVPFVQKFSIPYDILYTDSKTPQEFGLGRGIPVTIFFDSTGRETGRITGAQSPPVFYKQLEKIIK